MIEKLWYLAGALAACYIVYYVASLGNPIS